MLHSAPSMCTSNTFLVIQGGRRVSAVCQTSEPAPQLGSDFGTKCTCAKQVSLKYTLFLSKPTTVCSFADSKFSLFCCGCYVDVNVFLKLAKSLRPCYMARCWKRILLFLNTTLTCTLTITAIMLFCKIKASAPTI